MNHPGKNALTKTALIKFGDIAGMTASVLCLLHCLAMPLVILALALVVLVAAGGIIPDDDLPALREAGVAAVFGPGTTIAQVADFIRANVRPLA